MKVARDGFELHVEIEGPAGAPTVLFAHSLASTLGIWDAQVEALRDRWRCVRFDARGHGRSTAPPAPWTLEDLADDAIAVLDAVGAETADVVGISMGGMVAQVLALRASGRVRSLVLADTASRVDPSTRPTWDERIRVAREEGLAALADATLGRWLTARFRGHDPEEAARIRAMIVATSVEGYVGCSGAIAELDVESQLGSIDLPALVLVGAEDVGTPVEVAHAIAEALPRAGFVVVPAAAHLSNVEQPEAFTQALLRFLEGERA